MRRSFNRFRTTKNTEIVVFEKVDLLEILV